MAIEDALAALADYRDEVLSELGPQAARNLAAQVKRLENPAEREDALGAIAGILIEGLPPRHPVRRKLAGGDLFAPPVLDWPELAAAFGTQELPAQEPSALSAADILSAVTARLLAAPALTEEEVRQRGADPLDHGLIRLDRPDGSQQWPAFQFARDSGPISVVRSVNIMLHAARDPVGVADWWLSQNGRLNGQPSQLLGQVPDEDLIGAARAVGSEV